jgi:superkiller protein 3
LGTALLGCIVAGLCVLSNLQSRIYHDPETLWQDTLAKNPDSPMAHANYADVLRARGDVDGAQAQYVRAMQLRDDATDRIGVGQCYFVRGDYMTALSWYRAAAAAMADSPERVLHQFRTRAFFQIGTAYAALADQAEGNPSLTSSYRQQAIAAYQQAIQAYPLNEDAMTNLSALLLAERLIPQTIEQCQHVLDIDPDSVPALTNLGDALLAEGRLDESMAQYVRVLQIEPLNANAFNNVGAILAQRGQLDEAIAQFELALRIDPHFDKAHRNLLAALALKAQRMR